MKLPKNVILAEAKFTQYLLLPRKRDDKSKWLAGAGYSVETWQRLAQDIREQLLALEARFTEQTQFGSKYEIRGTLTGPNGRQLAVRTIWMWEAETDLVKFVTLFPDKT